MTPVFITGGTGYIGRRLIKKLVSLGYDVTALVRQGSEMKLPKGVRAIIADPFDAATFQQWIKPGSVFIHLLGATPFTLQARQQLQETDLRGAKSSANAAAAAGISHFVYASTAMTRSRSKKDFQELRREGESYLLSKGFPSTFIRPWYVLGPGRWWPTLLLPFYAIAKLKKQWRKKAEAMGLITIGQMLDTLMKAIHTPPQRLRVFEVKHIKQKSLPAI